MSLDRRAYPRFERSYAELGAQIRVAFERYAKDVRSGDFPSEHEWY